jgi:uncharacterized FlaG/YvyC family protein
MNLLTSLAAIKNLGVTAEASSRSSETVLSPRRLEFPSSMTQSGPGHPSAPPIDLSRAVQQIQTYLMESGKNLSISYDDSIGRYVTRIVDESSGEVIQTIPSEQALQTARLIEQRLGGLVNKRA